MSTTVESATCTAARQVIVKPMTIHIGAEISGIDLCQPLAAAEVNAIRQALLDWKVVFFRDQHQAIGDVYDSEFERKFYRVILNGAIPLGIDGKPSQCLSGAPIPAV